MLRKNKSLYTVLGYLATGPKTGYDIKKQIDGGIRHFWNESFGQLYPILKQLVDLGLALVNEETSEGRSKKIYSITDKGMEELTEWLRGPIEAQVVRSELLLKLFFGHFVGTEKVKEHIINFRHELLIRLNTFRIIEEGLEERKNNEQLLYWILTLRHGILTHEAQLKWCEESLARLDTSNNF